MSSPRFLSTFKSSSPLSRIQAAPVDPILGLTTHFLNDLSPHKINLGVGAYRDNNGHPWILPSVAIAQTKIKLSNNEYIPILGTSTYIKNVQQFLFNNPKSNPHLSRHLNTNNIVSAQGISGTGSLKIISDFISSFLPGSQIALPNPTWPNHPNIFKSSHLPISTYAYYNPSTKSLDFSGLLYDLNLLKPNDVVLFHACCHNPTGVDPSNDQWDEILTVCKSKQLIPLFDIAYQGLGNGLIDDLFVLEKTAKLNIPFFITQSFAKNMGLYGHRIGSFHYIGPNGENIQSQLKRIVRANYSSPSIYGSLVVNEILQDPTLRSKWDDDVSTMRNRLKLMRSKLFQQLTLLNCPGDWNHLISQNGMFCYTGLNPNQVKLLANLGVYMTNDGRISVAGINDHNVEYLANSIKNVIKE